MSKNIIIQEGGVGKQLTADKLKTNLVGGGTCLWVPEDERQLGTKNITADGTYKATDDGYYGYSEVTVNGIGKASGTGPDGEPHEYEEDGQGGVTDTILPSSISVVTPPTVTTYADGALIDFSGMVVKGFLKSGGTWSDASHPNGIIPINELTLPVTRADKGEGRTSEYSDGHGVNAVKVTYSQHWDKDWQQQDYAVYVDMHALGSHEGEAAYLKGQGMANLYVTRYNGEIYAYLIQGDNGFDYTFYSAERETYKYYGGGATAYRTTQGEWTRGVWGDVLTNVPVSTSDPHNAGEMQPLAAQQSIPVQYLRTDGKTLESSFDISVI